METKRDDVSIAIRSAFLQKGTQQRFSLIVLIIFSIILLFVEKIETKPLNFIRSIVQDVTYRGSSLISTPPKIIKIAFNSLNKHMNLYDEYNLLEKENNNLKNKVSETDFLLLENNTLRELIADQINSPTNLISTRVMLDKQSLYLNSFILNSGSNKNIKNGMAVLDGKNFIGRIVDVNFFSSRVLLISDLNSKIAVIVEPLGYHAILNGQGQNEPILEYLPENHKVESGNKIYTSGKEGIFSSGIPIGTVNLINGRVNVSLFSNLTQISFVNIKTGDF